MDVQPEFQLQGNFHLLLGCSCGVYGALALIHIWIQPYWEFFVPWMMAIVICLIGLQAKSMRTFGQNLGKQKKLRKWLWISIVFFLISLVNTIIYVYHAQNFQLETSIYLIGQICLGLCLVIRFVLFQRVK